MAKSSVVGEILNPRLQVSIEWEIPNYFSLPQKADSSISSPNFHFLNTTWYLRLCPNGERSNHSVEYMSLHLYKSDSEIYETVNVNYQMGIRSHSGGTFLESVFTNTSFTNISGHGYRKFIKRSELFRNKEEITPRGVLTIFCNIKSGNSTTANAAIQSVSVDSFSTLVRDFCCLLQNKRKSDVTIKVKKREFRVHKLILAARSPVFASAFDKDTKGAVTGTINIPDCDPDVFYEFLYFLYTGEIEKLSLDNVFQLFSLSKNYCISDLKEICSSFLKNHLSLVTACKVVNIADKHGEEELKDLAAELIIDNIKELIPTVPWMSLMKHNPRLASELLMTALPDY